MEIVIKRNLDPKAGNQPDKTNTFSRNFGNLIWYVFMMTSSVFFLGDWSIGNISKFENSWVGKKGGGGGGGGGGAGGRGREVRCSLKPSYAFNG